MINPSIHRILLGKRESEAIAILKKFKCPFQVISRDGGTVNNILNDRNDDRYNLIIANGVVERVIAG